MQPPRNYWKQTTIVSGIVILLLIIAHAQLILRYNANKLYIVDFTNMPAQSTKFRVIDKGQHSREEWHNGNSLNLLADSRKKPKVQVLEAEQVMATIALAPGRSEINISQIFDSRRVESGPDK